MLDPYQIEGAEFLAGRSRALLADVMGVGKSAQAVAACDIAGAQTVIVACQAGKRLDWSRDFPRWSGVDRPMRIISSATDTPLPVGITICSYDLIDVVLGYLDMMDVRADVLIIDEVQFLKSPGAQRTKRVLGKGGIVHRCDKVWLLSGTPMLNHPGEMWTWLYTLFPQAITVDGRVLDYDAYVARYCTVRETQWDPVITGGQNLDDLKARLWPIMLRRGEDVVDLPPLLPPGDLIIPREDIIHAEDIRLLLEAETGPGGRSLAAALSILEAGGEVDLEDLRDRGGHIATLRKVTGIAKTKPLCDRLVIELASRQMDKLVLFGVHRDALNLAHSYLSDAGFSPELVWGGTDPAKRDKRIHRFISNWKCRVFIGQVDAAGTGIDGLQHAANNVVFLETSWTPGINLQAVKRVHRRGQRRPVTTRFAHLASSLDERVQRVLRRKMATLAELFG